MIGTAYAPEDIADHPMMREDARRKPCGCGFDTYCKCPMLMAFEPINPDDLRDLWPGKVISVHANPGALTWVRDLVGL